MSPTASPSDRKTVYEPERRTPLVQSTDVIVCGGGPAGISAALTSARHGAHTTLIESHGCLGGVWTSGLLCWVLDAEGKPGVMAEICRELDARQARALRVPNGKGFAYDPEAMKLLLEELCTAAGVTLRYHTRVVAAQRTVDGKRLAHVVTESKSGREAWTANVFIDTTGDGDLGAAADCSFAMGSPDKGEVQPMSMIGLFTGVQFAEIEDFVGGNLDRPKQHLYSELARHGLELSNSVPLLIRIHDDLFALCANHEYGVLAHDADGITQATLRGRAETHQAIAALKKLSPAWSGIRLVTTAAQIGVREGRRIRGLHVVSDDEIVAGARHPDAACHVTFPIDVHSTNRENQKGIEKPKNRALPYDIPLRALIARDVDGLLLAGRCISGDFLAHSSYRVTGNAVVTGEAAGRTAAACVRMGITPHAFIEHQHHLA